MHTELYPQKIAAVYQDAATADAALRALEEAGLEHVQLTRLGPGDTDIDKIDKAIEPETRGTRDSLTRDTLTGTAAGTAAGAAVGGAAAAVTPALFLSAPVIGPLMALGYGAMIGGTAGAIRGLRMKETVLASLVKDALDAGYHAVIVHAANDEAQRRARDVIDETVTEQTAHT